MPRRSRKYEIGLADRLKDRAHAINYLNAAAEDSDEAFLLALRDVAAVQRGMTRISEEAEVNRENLYRMLSEEGNPRLSSFRSVLRALNLKYRVEDDFASSNRFPLAAARARIEKK
jgi:probable addiction module antidote protein